MLPSNPEMQTDTLSLALATFVITAAIGLYFVWLRGWQLLPIGILGLILLITYTTWWVYHPILCLIAPGVGFGILMVMGTHFALTGTFSLASFIASLVPTFLVSDLLLLNQFPDVEADGKAGRKTTPITMGKSRAAIVYSVLTVVVYLWIIGGVVAGQMPVFSLVALLTLPLAFKAIQGALRHQDMNKLMPAMANNVQVVLLTQLLLGIGYILARVFSS